MENCEIGVSEKQLNKIIRFCEKTQSEYCLIKDWIKIVGDLENWQSNVLVYIHPVSRYKSFLRNIYKVFSEQLIVYSNCNECVDGLTHEELIKKQAMPDKNFQNIIYGSSKSIVAFLRELDNCNAELVIIKETYYKLDILSLQKRHPNKRFIVLRNLKDENINRRKCSRFDPDIILNLYDSPLIGYKLKITN